MLALIISGECVRSMCSDSFYHFGTVVTHAIFGLSAVATFLEASNVPTTD